MISKHLKPCPFCGGQAQLLHAYIYTSKDNYRYIKPARVICTKCKNISGPADPLALARLKYNTSDVSISMLEAVIPNADKQAVASWNARIGEVK